MENLSKVSFKDFFTLCVTKIPTKIERGLYLVYYLHNGIRQQSKFYIINISGYNTESENYFVKAISLIPGTDNATYAIEYNSATREVKIVDNSPTSGIIYGFTKIL